MIRKYVSVIVMFDVDGTIKPLAVKWEDGRIFNIDKIYDMRWSRSLKAGGSGARYLCKIKNRDTYLFNEEDRWFVEVNN